MKKLAKLAIVLLTLGAIVWGLTNDFWQVKRLDCHTNGDPCPPSLWAELMNQVSGENLLFLATSKLSQEVSQKHPEFFQLAFTKQWPDALAVKIEVRKPTVAIAQKDGYFLVDGEGILLKRTADRFGLPVIFETGEISQPEREKISEKLILKQVETLNESQWRLLKPKSSRAVSERAFEIEFKDGLVVLFSAEKEVAVQLDSLQFIQQRLKIEGSQPKRLDLRFDKPIIVE